MTEYVGVLLYIRFATGLGIIILFAAAKVAPRRLDQEKATAYECGFEPFGEARSPFDIGFYLVAILFLIFDQEVAFLLPWVLGGISTGFHGFFSFVLFQVVQLLGFVYEWQKGALDWTSYIPALGIRALIEPLRLGIGLWLRQIALAEGLLATPDSTCLAFGKARLGVSSANL